MLISNVFDNVFKKLTETFANNAALKTQLGMSRTHVHLVFHVVYKGLDKMAHGGLLVHLLQMLFELFFTGDVACAFDQLGRVHHKGSEEGMICQLREHGLVHCHIKVTVDSQH